ncbi:GNAT family N-acetyltransferase [Methyloceanibacter superfactus]|uniref:GNAT family N-acetyltransferase n=1 Tax=Methyloceanibacter superfactus TaxID=1774969 RepID=UPI00114D2403|nr:GNAT family N-acetyltransferase [Methyloceanibacter superfactus]
MLTSSMTNAFKFLIDTNVVIGLEDNSPADARLTDLARKCSTHGVRLFVDSAVDDDIQRDRDAERRSITLSKLERFERLAGVPYPDDAELARRYGAISSDNDLSDVRLLFCLEQGAADFLITQDVKLIKRASRCLLSGRVMSVEDALVWLRQTFEPTSVELPHVTEQEAYALDRSHPIFDGLRDDYTGFDQWLEKCARKHRKCWTVMVGGELAGVVIRKDEARRDACIQSSGEKILKLCTFKMAPEFRGEKFGEHLLKQSLWFAQANCYDVVYLTAFADKEELISLLQSYGFSQTSRLQNGELVFEKVLLHGDLNPSSQEDVLDFDRKCYPRFYDGQRAAKYCVPIKGEYHKKLFPEISFRKVLPLFEGTDLTNELAATPDQARVPGNCIRKVYLCRAKASSLRPGDLLFFYLSKDDELEASQSITTVGIVESVSECDDASDLIRMTAKRSVFSRDELVELAGDSGSPVKVIDFLLVGHSRPTAKLADLVAGGVFNGRPPQSIAKLSEDRFLVLKGMLDLGFDA